MNEPSPSTTGVVEGPLIRDTGPRCAARDTIGLAAHWQEQGAVAEADERGTSRRKGSTRSMEGEQIPAGVERLPTQTGRRPFYRTPSIIGRLLKVRAVSGSEHKRLS